MRKTGNLFKKGCAWLLVLTTVLSSSSSGLVETRVYANETETQVIETANAEDETTEVTSEASITEVSEEASTEVASTEEVTTEVSTETSEVTTESTEVTTEVATEDTTEVEATTEAETSKEGVKKEESEVEETKTDEDTKETTKDLFVSLSEGGRITFTYADGGKKTIENKNGEYVTTVHVDTESTLSDGSEKNEYKLVSTLELGSVVDVKVEPNSNYYVGTYHVLKDGGETEKYVNEFSSDFYNDKVTLSGDRFIKVEFSKEDEVENTDSNEIVEKNTLYLSVNYGGGIKVISDKDTYNYYLNKEGKFILESSSGKEDVSIKVINGGYPLKVDGTVKLELYQNRDGLLSSLSLYNKDFNRTYYKSFTNGDDSYSLSVNVDDTPYIIASFSQILNEDSLTKDDNTVSVVLYNLQRNGKSAKKQMKDAEEYINKDSSKTYLYGTTKDSHYTKKYKSGSFQWTSGHIGDGLTANGKFTSGILKGYTAVGVCCWMHTAAGYDADKAPTAFTYNVKVAYEDEVTSGKDKHNARYKVTVNIFAYDEKMQGGFNGKDAENHFYMFQSSGLIYYYDAPSGGYGRVKKSSTKTKFLEYANYSFDGAEFTVYKDSACTKKADSCTLDIEDDISGKVVTSTTSDELDAGTYYIKETKAPAKGFLINSTPVEVKIEDEKTKTVSISDEPIVNDPQFKIYKYHMGTTTPVSGAEYTVKWYDLSTSDGLVSAMYSKKLEWGTEPSAPKMTATYVSDHNGLVNIESTEPVTNKGFPTFSDGTIQIPLGFFTIEETEAPAGYLRDTKIYVCSVVQSGTSSTIKWHNLSRNQIINGISQTADPTVIRHDEQPITGTVSIQKVNDETGKPEPFKGTNFKGVTFGIYNTSGKTIKYGLDIHDVANNALVTTLTCNEAGFAEIPVNSDVRLKLPEGTYTIKETRGNSYYSINKEYSQSFTIHVEGQRENLTMTKGNPPIRGEVEFRKKENWKDSSGNNIIENRNFAGIPFLITHKETGEKHIVVTDENGFWSSKVYKNDMNSNDKILNVPELERTKDILGKVTGIYFGLNQNGTSVIPDSDVGSFLVGSYTIQELRCRLNMHTNLVSSTFSIKSNNTTVLNLGDFVNKHTPKISTVALDSETNSHISRTGMDVTINDTVYVENLPLDNKWHIKGVLMDITNPEDIKPLTIDGKEVTAESEQFTSAVSNMEVVVPFSFNSEGLEDKVVCVYEYLYNDTEIENGTTPNDGDLFLYAKEDNPNNINQIVKFPKVDTSAYDFITKTKVGMVVPLEEELENQENVSTDNSSSTTSEESTNTEENNTSNTGSPEIMEVKIIDTVEYSNVEVGVDYTIKGEVVNKKTEEVVATNEKPFTAEATSGVIDVDFTFNEETSTLKDGIDYVCYQYLYQGDVCLLEHNDINNTEQTVSYSSLKTKARDELSNTSTGTIGEKINIIDTVEYTNLLPNKVYTIKGKLMNKATGEPLLVGGNEITSEVTFSPESANGTVDLTYTLNSTDLQGETIVVFEDLYSEGIKVASHADIEDEDQTIHFPKISTQAKDINTTDNVGVSVKTTIVDTVKYENLVVGQEYIVSGVLMDKLTGEYLGKDLGLEPIKSSTTFKPTEKNGTVDVSFVVDTDLLKGKTTVVFEDLKVGEKVVTTHSDINDEGQTVHFPDIETSATSNGEKETIAKGSITITDTVTYSNLVIGKTYTIKGKLMLQESNEPLLIDGSEVTAETTFTAETANGSVDLVFIISDASVLAGETVVVFEDLYHNNIKVATHSDIEDENQSVDFPKIGTKATSEDGKKDIGIAKKTVLVDTVSYSNLQPDVKYILKGSVIDKKSKKVIGKASVEFTPKEADGETEVEFTINTEKLAEQELVVFEELYNLKGNLVAEHKDLEDEGQTVTVSKEPELPRTFDTFGWLFNVGGMLLMLSGAYIIFSERSKRLRKRLSK